MEMIEMFALRHKTLVQMSAGVVVAATATAASHAILRNFTIEGISKHWTSSFIKALFIGGAASYVAASVVNMWLSSCSWGNRLLSDEDKRNSLYNNLYYKWLVAYRFGFVLAFGVSYVVLRNLEGGVANTVFVDVTAKLLGSLIISMAVAPIISTVTKWVYAVICGYANDFKSFFTLPVNNNDVMDLSFYVMTMATTALSYVAMSSLHEHLIGTALESEFGKMFTSVMGGIACGWAVSHLIDRFVKDKMIGVVR